MGSYQLSKTAEAKLDDLYLYGILNFGLRQADRYYDGLIARLDLLAQHSSWGSDYGFICPDLQRYEYGVHSIYYQPSKKGILIVQILGNKQDPARHFKQ